MSNISKSKQGYKKIKWLFGKEIKIPEEWACIILDRLTPLNEKSSIRMDPFGSSLKKHELLDSGKIKTIWIENIVNDKFVWKYQKFITEEKYVQLEGFTIKPNDLLITMMGTLGKIAIVPSDIGTAIISSHLLKITPESKKLISKFLYHFLKSQFIQKQIIREAHGLVMGGLNTGIIKKLLINTPPINEQQKIASILSGVDALIESTQKVIEKTERLKKGVMQYLLTTGIGSTKFKKVKWYHEKEIKIPNRWKWSELGKEGSLSSGATPRRDHPEYYDGDILWVSSGELDYNFITTTAETINVLGLQKTNLKIHSKGTFLFAITGLEAKGTRGRCAILGTEATTNQSCMAFYDSNSLDTKFLFYYFLTFGEKIIFAIAQGTKQQSLNLELSKKIKVPIPPLTEQQKIASILSGVDAYIQKNQQYKERLEKLKKGLMQKLLTGQIRVKV